LHKIEASCIASSAAHPFQICCQCALAGWLNSENTSVYEKLSLVILAAICASVHLDDVKMNQHNKKDAIMIMFLAGRVLASQALKKCQ
jgi:hypothetical protein